ncbi:MAG TPA: nucleoside-diphosphate sugar epimerase/dehydratase, partial [Paracoccus sp. (in: a-proteobacteria)]|nr:nucleoside-diphosphate sugar epimerase/dehydratase [Paracoccus sp. (in: a-proteobacteria)]
MFKRRLRLGAAELRANRKLFASDALSVAVGAAASVVLSSGPHFSSIERAALPGFVLLALAVTMPVMALSGVYRRHRYSSTLPGLVQDVPALMLSVLICAIAARAAGLLPELTLTTFPILFLILASLFTAARVAARMRQGQRELQRRPAREDSVPAVLVGLDSASDLFMRAVQQGLSRYRIVGVVDTSPGSTDLLFHSVPILGSVLDPQDIIRRLSAMPERPRCLLMAGATTHFDAEGIAVLRGWADAHGIRIRALPSLTDALEQTARTGGPAPIDPEDILTRPQKTVELALLRETYRGQRVLVTGAGGSIGSELVRQLASLDPAELILIENSELNAYQVDRMLARHFPAVPRKLHLCCIRDRQHLDAIFAAHRPDMVFNAAALKHVPLVEANPCEGVLTNVIGTRNVCDAARSFGARAMVQVSTDKAVNTTNIMGATKRVAEFYCQAQDLITRDLGAATRFFAVRFGNVLGSSGSLIPLFQEQIALGGPLTVTHPDMERYFMTIREAVELTLVSAAHGLREAGDKGRIFVLDMGNPVRIVDLAERMIRMAGKVPGQDIRIEFVGIRPGEKLFEELFDRAEQVLPASFAGVSCAVPHPIAMPRLRAEMNRLERAAREGDAAAVKAALAALVPGFGGERPAMAP